MYFFVLHALRYVFDIDFISLFTVRLQGPSQNYGILEVQVNNQWNVVCDSNFDRAAAKVVCKQLGYADGNYQTGLLMIIIKN